MEFTQPYTTIGISVLLLLLYLLLLFMKSSIAVLFSVILLVLYGPLQIISFSQMVLTVVKHLFAIENDSDTFINWFKVWILSFVFCSVIVYGNGKKFTSFLPFKQQPQQLQLQQQQLQQQQLQQQQQSVKK